MRLRFSLRTMLIFTLLVAVFCWRFLSPTDAKMTQQLRSCLADNEEDIQMFCDFCVVNENLTKDEFFYWWIDSYVNVGYEFHAVAGDGSGGRVAIWIRPDQKGPPPLVYFGSEGERRVITDSAWNWPMMLAHGPDFLSAEQPGKHYSIDYQGDDPALLAEQKQAKEALERYRNAVSDGLPDWIPSWKELRGDVTKLEKEFEDWLERCHQGEGEPYSRKK